MPLARRQLERQGLAVVALDVVVRPDNDHLDPGRYAHAIHVTREGLLIFVGMQELPPSQQLPSGASTSIASA